MIWNLLILSAFPGKIPSSWQPKCLANHVRKWECNTQTPRRSSLQPWGERSHSTNFLFLFVSSLRQKRAAQESLASLYSGKTNIYEYYHKILRYKGVEHSLRNKVVPVGKAEASSSAERQTIRQKGKCLLILLESKRIAQVRLHKEHLFFLVCSSS